MFEHLDLLKPDPILGLLVAARADTSPNVVDLGIGIYRDAHGKTPVLQAVHKAERALLQEQETKAYLGPEGNERFNARVAELVLGPEHPALRHGSVRVLQCPGGCAALRLGAELLQATRATGATHVSEPTWPMHLPILGGAGLRLDRYPYYDAASGGVNFDAMLHRLRSLPVGDVVLLHGACHNPTGADLTLEQWKSIAAVLADRSVMPFFDLAYQGLGLGLDEDVAGLRLVAQSVPETLISVSCSKNFGLYRERVGALMIIGSQRAHTEAAASHVARIARTLYSMPPDHGAEVVARILEDGALARQWQSELTEMRERISGLRLAFAFELERGAPQGDFSAIARQRGMFSLLDLPSVAVDRLRSEHHIYLSGDGRINIAGLHPESIRYVSRAIASLI
jgi:aspartate aminotransferase